jgi:hypothetical protein
MSYFQSHIPNELILEVGRFLSSQESWSFLNTSKELFSEIKFATRKICLRADDLKKFFVSEEFRNEISGKVLDRNAQLLFGTPKLHYQNFLIEHISDEAIAKWIKIFHSDQETGFEDFYLREIAQAFNNFKFLYIGKEFDIDYLPTCCIQHLVIDRNPLVVDVSLFSHIPILHISWCHNLHDLSPLKDHSRLEVYSCDITKFPSSVAVQFLGIDSKSSQILNSVNNSKLLHLLIYADNRVDLIDQTHSVLSGLKSLELNACDGLESLQGIPFIPKIVLRTCHNLKDISALQNPRCVEISRCHNIVSFAILKRVPRVNLDGCGCFTNGHDVANVHHLTIRSLTFKDARMLGNVHHLDLDCNQVDDFSGLENVEILKIIQIKEGHNLSAFSNGKNQKIIVRANEYSRNGFLDILKTSLPKGYEILAELRRFNIDPLSPF